MFRERVISPVTLFQISGVTRNEANTPFFIDGSNCLERSWLCPGASHHERSSAAGGSATASVNHQCSHKSRDQHCGEGSCGSCRSDAREQIQFFSRGNQCSAQRL